MAAVWFDEAATRKEVAMPMIADRDKGRLDAGADRPGLLLQLRRFVKGLFRPVEHKPVVPESEELKRERELQRGVRGDAGM